MISLIAHLGVKHYLVIFLPPGFVKFPFINFVMALFEFINNSNENIYFNAKTEFCLECENGEWSLELAFLMIMTAAENFKVTLERRKGVGNNNG